MARRPAYMAGQMKHGEIAHFEDGVWYICTRTSRRENGEYKRIIRKIAVSYPSGRRELSDAADPIAYPGNAQIYEFGFSYGMQVACPLQWKSFLRGDWEMLFLYIIQQESPESYLLKERTVTVPESRNPDLQRKRFWERIPDQIRMHLETLRSLHVIFDSDRIHIELPTDAQKLALDALGIDLSKGVKL